jgi:pilus assembly protein CpaB
VDILQGQQVLDSMLTVADQNLTLQQSGSDAALLVPAGQVAVAVEINRVSSVAYAIRPGDHVDIMISYRFVDVDEEWQTFLPNAVGLLAVPATVTVGTSPEVFGRLPTEQPFGFQWMVVPSEDSPRPRQATQLIIDNAVVMHTGDWPLTDEAVVVATQAPPADGAEAPPATEAAGAGATAVPPAVPTIVTLVMSRQDALVLKFSFEQGADIDFALRSALDNAVTDVTTETVSLQYLLDFYNLADPPKLPIALDPRTDNFVDQPSGEFPTNFGPGLFSFLTPEP